MPSLEYNIIFTTGGTGIGPRDITVDVIKPFITKEIPGIMELIRVKYGLNKPNAVLSRGVAGLAGNALIFTLPGSVKAVKEYMNEIRTLLCHTVLMQYGIDSHGKPTPDCLPSKLVLRSCSVGGIYNLIANHSVVPVVRFPQVYDHQIVILRFEMTPFIWPSGAVKFFWLIDSCTCNCTNPALATLCSHTCCL